MIEPSDLQHAAERAFGSDARITYGVDGHGAKFAAAATDRVEINVWSDEPMATLLMCLSALPEAK